MLLLIVFSLFLVSRWILKDNKSDVVGPFKIFKEKMCEFIALKKYGKNDIS